MILLLFNLLSVKIYKKRAEVKVFLQTALLRRYCKRTLAQISCTFYLRYKRYLNTFRILHPTSGYAVSVNGNRNAYV
jgi:hypothetical protein